MTSYDPALNEAIRASFPSASRRGRGRPATVIVNPLQGFIGPTTEYGQYPAFAMDILEGIARLDWHDRPIGVGGSSKPLSVKRLVAILADLGVISAATAQNHYSLGLRQAQRYVKAIELAMPYLLKSCPASLVHEIHYGYVDGSGHPNNWTDQLLPPSPETLAKLHSDMGPESPPD